MHNKRQGGARNTGILNASGEYVLFIDHDDVYLPNTLDKIYQSLVLESDIDVLMFDMQQTKNGLTKRHVYSHNHSNSQNGIQYIKNNEMTYAACLYAIRRSYIIDNNLFFIENKQFEDGDWCMRLLLGARHVKFSPIEAYHYIIRPNSTTSTQAGCQNITDALDSVLRWSEMYKQYEGQDPELTKILKHHWQLGAVSCSYRLVHINSLFKKIRLLRDYYGGRYGFNDGMYLATLSLLPTFSGLMIHLLLPILRTRLKQKHHR